MESKYLIIAGAAVVIVGAWFLAQQRESVPVVVPTGNAGASDLPENRVIDATTRAIMGAFAIADARAAQARETGSSSASGAYRAGGGILDSSARKPGASAPAPKGEGSARQYEYPGTGNK